MQRLKNKFISLTFIMISLCVLSTKVWCLDANLRVDWQAQDLPTEMVKRVEQTTSKAHKYDTEQQLKSIISDTEQLIGKILKSYGYYAYKISHTINKTKKGKATVSFSINTSTAIKVDNVVINYSPTTKFNPIDDLQIKPGDILVAKNVIGAAKQISTQIEKLNCFTNIEVSHQAVIDFNQNTAEVVYDVKPKAQVNYGPVEITGITTVSPEYVYRKVPWQQGECFKIKQVESFKSDLRASPLFSTVDVHYPTENQDGDEVPLNVHVKESLHRTIKIGVGYESDDGPSVYGSWEHQNIFGHNEIFDLNAKASPINQYFKIGYNNPYFHTPKQTLKSHLTFDRTATDQYESLSVVQENQITRKLNQYWQAHYGLGYRLSNVKEFAQTELFGLAFVPLGVSYDSRNNILNPKQGMYFKLSSSPYWDSLGKANTFVKSSIQLNNYFALGQKEYTVLASRLLFGSITGSGVKGIPADLRFYAGGGRSVRGYEYQSLSESYDGITFGGLSIIEVSAEFRQQLTKDYGGVLFIDGGNTYQDEIPDFNNPLRWGAGIGFRYYSSFGPIRLDLAFPINKRKDLDESFQIYISIGQSF